MLPILNVGPLAIQLPGLLLLMGLWLGLNIAEKTAQDHGVNPNDLYNLVFSSLAGALVSARLVFIASYPAAFVKSPLSIFTLSPELLDAWGGAAGGLLIGIVFIQKRKMSLRSSIDTLVPGLAVMTIFISLSNFASGDSFGSPTKVPWGISIWGATRHPTQLYQALAAIFILALLWAQRKRFVSQPAGLFFLVFAVLSATSRLFLEYFRGDSIVLPGGFRAAQIASWLILSASLYGIHYLIIQSAKTKAVIDK